MRIAVEATAAGPGGGASLLRHAIPALEASLPTAEFDVYVGGHLAGERFTRRVRTIAVGPFWGWAHRVTWVQTVFARIAKDYDIVLAPGNFAPLPCAYKTVLYVQNAHVLPQTMWRGEFGRAKRRMQRGLARLSIGRSRRVIFISNAMRQWARPYWCGRPDEPLVAHPGLTLQHVEQWRPSSPARVLAVANLVPHKRLDRTIRVFAGATREFGGRVRLGIAGGEVLAGSLAPLVRLAEQEGVARQVDFLGFLGGAELGRAYAESVCYLTNSALEAWPLPPLEALAVGVPVVVPDCEPFREVCGEYASYFPPEDEIAAASSVRNVLRRIAEGGPTPATNRDRGEQFSWSRFGEVVARSMLEAAEAPGC